MKLVALERGHQGDHREYLLAEIESGFIFPYFSNFGNYFGLKTIPGNPEILVEPQKILQKLRKITRDNLGCEEPK
jgi:hypothetical protein